MMRVAVFGPVSGELAAGTVGGVATHTTELAAALQARGADVAVVADNVEPEGSGRAVRASWGELYGVGGCRGRTQAVSVALRTLPGSLSALSRVASPSGRRALLTHGIPAHRAWSRAALLSRALVAARPTVLHVQQPDYRPLYVGWAGSRLPTVTTVHGLGMLDEDPSGALARLVEANLRSPGLVTAPSHFLARESERLGAAPEMVRVVPNAVDDAVFRPRSRAECRSELELDPDAPLVLFAGRATRLKGADDFIAAIAQARQRVPDLRAAVVGTLQVPAPPDSAPHPSPAPTVTRDGATREELAVWFGAADIVVVPSHYEGFGLVALEAMASARPVIASDVGGLPEVVGPETGVLVPPRTPDALAAAIVELLGDEGRRDRLGDAGAIAAASFTWDRTAASFASLYEELVASRPS